MLREEYVHIPAIFFTCLSCIGIYIVFFRDQLERKLLKTFKDLETDDYIARNLRRTGTKITPKIYYTYVYGIAVFMIALGSITAVGRRDMIMLFRGLFLAALFVWLLSPRDYLIRKVKSPFRAFVDALSNTNIEKCDREIYSSCIILKNLAIVHKERPMSADTIFETLQKNSKDLKMIYGEMLSLYRTGQRDEAFKLFGSSIGTSSARNYAALLEKVDRINPAELLNQVQSLLDSMQEKRLTDGYRKAQRNGIITLLMSSLCVMAVLGDFLLIVVFMDMIENLSYLGV